MYVWIEYARLSCIRERQEARSSNNCFQSSVFMMSAFKSLFNTSLSYILLNEGHMSYFSTVRGPDILHNVIVSGNVTFYQMNKFFVITLLLLARCLHGPDEIVSQAGFGSRAVAWRPLL